MLSYISTLLRDEDGAVTVDWVVLTAALVGLGIAIAINVGGISADHADRVEDTMISQGIRSY